MPMEANPAYGEVNVYDTKRELVDSTINISGMDITVILWYNTTCVYAFL